MKSTEEATNYGLLYLSVRDQIQALNREITVLRHKKNMARGDILKAFYEKNITAKKEILQNLVEIRQHIEDNLF